MKGDPVLPLGEAGRSVSGVFYPEPRLSGLSSLLLPARYGELMLLTWDRDSFHLAAANVHARAVASKVRDGMCAEVLLGFGNSPAAHLTVIGRDRGTGARSATAETWPAPNGMTALPGTVVECRRTVSRLISRHPVTALCYTHAHPDEGGRYLRTVAAWPREMVVVTYLTDTERGVKLDPDTDPVAVAWEDWLVRMIPIQS